MYHEIHTPSGTYNFTVHPIGTQLHRLSRLYLFIIIPVADAPKPVAAALEATSSEKPKPLAFEARHPEPVEAQQKNTQHPAMSSRAESRGIIQPFSLLYIGITNNFNARLKQHHKIQAAINLGMTHIGILKISSGRKRKKIEREILKHLNPPLNQTWLIDILPSSPFGG